MVDLTAQVVPVAAIGVGERARMLALMQGVYEGVDPGVFSSDLAGKDECILLRAPGGELVGFSTQRLMTVPVGGREVEGLFSGDVVIHPDHWGSPALFQAFARRYVTAERERWWFLISKGHRTYRMLPLFFEEFYPDRRRPTPPAAQALMDAYATALYPGDYDAATGVLTYRTPKDRVRAELAGDEARVARQPDAAFFLTANPGHRQGHDLVCLARLAPDNLRARLRPHLLGEGA